MNQRPAITGRQLVRGLEQHGFAVVRVRGSHHRLAHAGGRKTVVPIRSGDTISKGLLAGILKDCGLTRDDIDRFL
jgi:predicted RNA binding protein YcfA (HicA-like mRNA interferase family)